MAFHANDLLERLHVLTVDRRPRRWVVAYSGGVDSTVLLHALAVSPRSAPILAVHIDHGLQAASASWAAHCARVAAGLGVDFECHKVLVTDDGSGLEAAARQARYAVFAGLSRAGDCLLSGHHEDDQAETLLLNLMRGSGLAGLAGIGASQPFGRGTLLRPLLGVAGADIEEYAVRHELCWIDDPSNLDTRFDRNFLREQVLPKLASRWPAVAGSLRRSAELVSEANELLNDLADIDLAACGVPARLSIAALEALTPARQRNVLRRAVRLRGLPPVPATRLEQTQQTLMPARADARPLVTWPGAEIRRYQDHLYIQSALEPVAAAALAWLYPCTEPLQLGPGLGALSLVASAGPGLDPHVAEQGLTVRFRVGGEQIRIAGQGVTRKLKKLLQEAAIVPWMRDRLPLLFAGDRLVAVGDLWVSADHCVPAGLAVAWLDKPVLI